MIQLKRVYEEPTAHDGTRFLVERLWPMGVRKTEYVAELNGRPEAWEPILKAAGHGAGTLLYSSRDTRSTTMHSP